jgi:transposase
MSDLIWLTEAQMPKIEPYFPLSHGVPRVDDRRIISGIIFVIQGGLRWRDAPREYGPAQDDSQSVRPMEPDGRVQQDVCRPRRQGWQA